MVLLAFVFILTGAGVLAMVGVQRSRSERLLLAFDARGQGSAPPRRPPVPRWLDPANDRRRKARAGTCLGVGCLLGLRLAGPPGAILGALAGVLVFRMLRRKDARSRTQALERQLADLVDACTLAVRGGASVAQALDVAASEVEEPMASLVARAVSEQRLGAGFEPALEHLAGAIGTEDARLFALVMAIHHRSGGVVAGPLDEVASTIRHRIAVRRELRALTAQGRISGTVLGVLPVGFFVVLSATSHRELAPVYASPAGAAMIIGGLVLEGFAYLWIRHLLRVEV